MRVGEKERMSVFVIRNITWWGGEKVYLKVWCWGGVNGREEGWGAGGYDTKEVIM